MFSTTTVVLQTRVRYMTVHGVVAGASERLPMMTITYRIKGEGFPPQVRRGDTYVCACIQQLNTTKSSADRECSFSSKKAVDGHTNSEQSADCTCTVAFFSCCLLDGAK